MRPGVAAAGALSLATACGGAPVRAEVTLGPILPARIVAVYPFMLRWDAPAYRSYELAMDEVDAVLATGLFAAAGPTEFSVRSFATDELLAATDVGDELPAWGVAPTSVLGLRGWAERRETTDSEILYDLRGRAAGGRRNAKVDFVIHEELLSPIAAPIAEVSAVVPVDPFGDGLGDSLDATLRRWTMKLTRAVLAAAAARLSTAAPVRDAGVDLLPSLRAEEGFSLPGFRSLAEILAPKDPLDREAARLDRVAALNPGASPSLVATLARLPEGLYVTRVRSAAARAAGLRAGDLVTAVDGEPAAGRQTLLRHLSLAAAPGVVTLSVLRDADRLTLRLPVPER